MNSSLQQILGAILFQYKKYGSLLILRTDNLPAAIQACRSGGWNVLTGQASLDFIKQITGFDMELFLRQNDGNYSIGRDLI